MNEGLQRLADRIGRRRAIHHVALVVESGDGSSRWVGAVGPAWPDGPPMDATTPFNIASIDKLLVATVIMRLAERGEIALDGSITGYLPGNVVAGLHRIGDTDHTGEITVRHLLSHTSGLRDSLEEGAPGETSFLEEILETGDRAWTLAEAIDRSRRMPPHFPPQPLDTERPKIRYSSTNFEILMLIIETVTGGPIEAALHDHLIASIGMDRTWLADRSQPSGGALEPATLWAGDRPLDLPLAMRSVPIVYSTAVDLISFMRALVRGDLFDRPETLDDMQARWLRFGFPRDKAALRAPSWPIEYGLGIKRFQMPRFMPPFRRRPAVIGHTGSTGTWLFYCPELDVFTAGTADQLTAGAVPYRTVPRILDLVGRI